MWNIIFSNMLLSKYYETAQFSVAIICGLDYTEKPASIAPDLDSMEIMARNKHLNSYKAHFINQSVLN